MKDAINVKDEDEDEDDDEDDEDDDEDSVKPNIDLVKSFWPDRPLLPNSKIFI